MVSFDVSGITDKFKEIYQSREFPVIWLGGFVVVGSVSNDSWWILPGIVGFAYWLIWKTRR